MIKLPDGNFSEVVVKQIFRDLSESDQQKIINLFDTAFDHPWVDDEVKTSIVNDICNEYGFEIPKEYGVLEDEDDSWTDEDDIPPFSIEDGFEVAEKSIENFSEIVVKKCVHTEHCDYAGCKYGDKDCLVYLGYALPSYPESSKPSAEIFEERRRRAEWEADCFG